MNTKKEKLLNDTYQSFMDQGLGRTNPDTLNEIVSKEIMGFGSTADEKIFGVEDLLKLLKIQREQSEGLDMTWKIEPVSRYVNAEENLAVFADNVHLTANLNGEKIKMYLRFSSVMEYTNDKWLAIHFHASKPEEVQSEEDTFGIENWKQKVEKLEKIVAERTADLVEKNRELEIEAALEKVRSRSLAMHKSEEMPEVANIVYERILDLNIEIDNAIVIILKENSPELEYWVASPGQNYPTMLHIPRTDKTVVLKGFQAARDAGENISLSYPFEVKNELWNYLFEETDFRTIQEERKKLLLESKGYSTSISFEKNTALQANRFSAKSFSEDENKILKRFAKVFEQAYTRFLDLQKAEAQAREAEIELALERVRARTMAMQHSDELAEASFLLDEQVRGLGIKTRGCAFNIYGDKESTEWFSSEMGTMPTYKTPREKVFLDYYEAGQKGETFLTKEFSGKECVDWYNYLCTLPIMGDGLKQMIAAGGSFPIRQIDHVSFFKYGYLLFLTFEPVPEFHEIFKRFAKVFEQTYTRFLDLQKAEEQAQKAEMDLIEIRTARKKAEDALQLLQQTQKQLIQSEKMASLGELTAGIAHEIQNPLNFVNNFSEVNKELLAEMNDEMAKGNMESAKEIANDVIENSEKINHHGKRAGDIVKGMLQHSRASTGAKELTDINALCDEYLRLSYHGLRAKDKSFNADFKTYFDESIGKINIIPQDIGRVLLNLYNNAFYAVQQRQKELAKEVTPFQKVSPLYEPTVSVTTKKFENQVLITVTDNGNGIPQNIVDKIFQPFFTTKPAGSGTGLGLSLSYDIIKAHGGEIKVESQPVEAGPEAGKVADPGSVVKGGGTTFIIQLPVV
ncbi:MAG: ATP-binding protein [Ginsengibacter sp.]